MAQLACSCSKHVGENIKHCECGTYMIKHGKGPRQKQRYFIVVIVSAGDQDRYRDALHA
jgi:hypothetical protein